MRAIDFADGYESSAAPTDPGLAPAAGTGSFSSPVSITAGGGITSSLTEAKEVQYVVGSGGAVDITANPQVSAGSVDNQELELVGTSDTNTVLLENGDGLALNGSCTLTEGAIIGLRWDSDSSVWRERYRNGMA